MHANFVSRLCTLPGLRSFLFVTHALRNMGLIASHVVNAQVVELSAIESALPQLPLTLLSFKAAQLQWQIAAQSLAVANAMLLVTKLKHEEQEKLVNAAELHLRLCATQRNLAALRHRNLVLFESCSSSTCTDDEHQQMDDHSYDDCRSQGESCSLSVHRSFLATGVRHELDLVVNPVVIQGEMMDVGGAIEGAMTDSTCS